MRSWPVQDAKTRFSELVETCLREGPQLVTRRGKDAVVLVPSEEWESLKVHRVPSRKQVLLEEGPKGDLAIPSRKRLRRRQPRPL